MFRPLGTKAYLAIGLGLLFVILSVAVVVMVNMTMRGLALTDAEDASRMLLDHNLAITTYFSKDLKPKLFEQLAPIMSKDYFEPLWMSSTYAKRKMQDYFYHFSKSPYYYKECAINARSPQNEADDYEKAFLSDLQNDPQLTTRSAIRFLDGKPYFTFLRRGEAMEASCLRCHSTPEKAPGDLVRHYGPERSFHRTVDEVVQAISIRIPLSEAFSSATSFSYYLSGLLLVALGGGFLFVWVGNKRMVIDPITRIQEHAVKIASESESLGETIPEPKLKELRDLVSSFNKMSVQLRKTYDGQEQRILESTKALTAANEQLRKEIEDRKNAEAALRKSEELYRSLFENMLNGLAYCQMHFDDQGRPWDFTYLAVNGAFETQTGLKDVVGKRVSEVISGIRETDPELFEIYGRVAASGRPECFEMFVEALQMWFWISVYSTERGYFVAVFEVITERKKAEEALKQSQEMLSLATEGANLGLWDWDLTTGKAVWSERNLEQLGYEPGEIEPSVKNWKELVHPNDWPKVSEDLNNHIQGKSPLFETEYRIRQKSGKWLWVYGRGNVIQRDTDGKPIRMAGVVLDISDRKKVEEALKESEKRYRALFEGAAEGILVADTETKKVNFANPAICEMFGYTMEQMLRLKVADLHPQNSIEHVIAEFEALQKGEKALTAEIPCLRQDASVFYADVVGRPVVIEGREMNVSFFTDITERKMAEKEREILRSQILQAQKMEAIGTLTGGIAHDFNNLLTIINGYTEMLLLGKTDDDTIYSDLQKILQTGRKGAEMVQRLLAFTKQGEYSPEPMNLNTQIELTKKLLERTLPKMIQIETCLSEDLRIIHADAGQIEQLLMNLCVNSKDAMPEGGQLRIVTRNMMVGDDYCRLHAGTKPGLCVLIEISDTGIGMSKETVNRMFDPFFTSKGWDSRKGTGLGLSVAKGIVERHGGWVTCESEPGKGTTFRIYFPAIVEEPVAEEPAPVVDRIPDSKKILLVDDEEYVRDLGKRILEREGYDVITASNGGEALDVYARERSSIALVVLDLIMPQMSGEKVLEELVKLNPRVKVIISTGHSLDSRKHLHLGSLAKAFVNKPYDVKQLAQCVREVLEAEGYGT